MEPNLAEMKKFKQFIHGKDVAVYQIFSKHEDRKKKPRIITGKWITTVYNELVKENTVNKMEVGMAINRCNGNGRTTADVIEILALFVDFDGGEMSQESLLALPVVPHLVIETSPGNYHAYWLIKDCAVEQFKSVQKALAAKLGADDSVVDPGRAMRVGGSVNWKRKNPFLTRIVYLEERAIHISLKEFIKKMQLRIDTKAKHLPVASQENFSKLNTTHAFTQNMQARIETALRGVPADDRWHWYRFGSAIHNEDSSEAGYKVWTKWARTSSKFSESQQRKTWAGFKRGGGVNIETLFWLTNRIKGGNAATVDEMSMAEMFADSSKKNLRFDRENREWLYFDDVTWKADMQAPQRAVRRFISDLSLGDKGDLSDSIKRFRSTAAIKAIVSQAELLDEMRISAQAFDVNADLLAVKNGVVNLRTGEFRLPTPGDYLRRKASVEYSESAKCPVWINFMRAITCGDKNLYYFLKRTLGYTLYGDANLQIFFISIGSGGNGKGTLLRTVQKILGDYAISVAPNLLTGAYSGNANGPSPALAKLYGARMVVCSELPSNRRFDEAFIKQYAGGDEITARPTYGDVFSFKPEGKLWLSANDPPEIRANDDAMWRRLIPLPFNARFDGQKRDDDLEKKFIGEYAGILNWLLAGAKDYAASGIGSCAAVEQIKQKMRKDADSVLAWISERCIENATHETPSSAAYDDYLNFMRKMRRKAVNASTFRANLIEKGYQAKRKSTGNFFTGFRLQNASLV